MGRDGARKIEVDQSGLNARAPVAHVELDDPVHSCRRDDEAALRRNRAAAQAGTGAARHDRFAALAGDAYRERRVPHVVRNHRSRGQPSVAVCVEGIHCEIFRGTLHGVRPERFEEA
jgi:hypothetical protein